MSSYVGILCVCLLIWAAFALASATENATQPQVLPSPGLPLGTHPENVPARAADPVASEDATDLPGVFKHVQIKFEEEGTMVISDTGSLVLTPSTGSQTEEASGSSDASKSPAGDVFSTSKALTEVANPPSTEVPEVGSDGKLSVAAEVPPASGARTDQPKEQSVVISMSTEANVTPEVKESSIATPSDSVRVSEPSSVEEERKIAKEVQGDNITPVPAEKEAAASQQPAPQLTEPSPVVPTEGSQPEPGAATTSETVAPSEEKAASTSESTETKPSKDATAASESIDPHKVRGPDASVVQDRLNVAAYDAGAKLISASKGLKKAKDILNGDSDRYLMYECKLPGEKFVIIQLSEDMVVDTVVTANLEHYSSGVKDFRVFGATEYPTASWTLLGTLRAEDNNSPQAFKVLPFWARYMKVVFDSYHENEGLCTMTYFRVYGTTMFKQFEEELKRSTLEAKQNAQKSLEDLQARVNAQQPEPQPTDEAWEGYTSEPAQQQQQQQQQPVRVFEISVPPVNEGPAGTATATAPEVKSELSNDTIVTNEGNASTNTNTSTTVNGTRTAMPNEGPQETLPTTTAISSSSEADAVKSPSNSTVETAAQNVTGHLVRPPTVDVTRRPSTSNTPVVVIPQAQSETPTKVNATDSCDNTTVVAPAEKNATEKQPSGNFIDLTQGDGSYAHQYQHTMSKTEDLPTVDGKDHGSTSANGSTNGPGSQHRSSSPNVSPLSATAKALDQVSASVLALLSRKLQRTDEGVGENRAMRSGTVFKILSEKMKELDIHQTEVSRTLQELAMRMSEALHHIDSVIFSSSGPSTMGGGAQSASASGPYSLALSIIPQRLNSSSFMFPTGSLSLASRIARLEVILSEILPDLVSLENRLNTISMRIHSSSMDQQALEEANQQLRRDNELLRERLDRLEARVSEVSSFESQIVTILLLFVASITLPRWIHHMELSTAYLSVLLVIPIGLAFYGFEYLASFVALFFVWIYMLTVRIRSAEAKPSLSRPGVSSDQDNSDPITPRQLSALPDEFATSRILNRVETPGSRLTPPPSAFERSVAVQEAASFASAEATAAAEQEMARYFERAQNEYFALGDQKEVVDPELAGTGSPVAVPSAVVRHLSPPISPHSPQALIAAAAAAAAGAAASAAASATVAAFENQRMTSPIASPFASSFGHSTASTANLEKGVSSPSPELMPPATPRGSQSLTQLPIASVAKQLDFSSASPAKERSPE